VSEAVPDDQGAHRLPGVRGRHVVLGVLAAVAVGCALVLGIGRAAGYAHLRQALSNTSPRWLVLCAAGQVLVFTGYAGALRSTLSDDGVALAAGPALRLTFASFAAAQLLAFGGLGGLAVMYWAMRRLGMERRRAAVRLIGLETAVYLVFAVLGWAAAAAALVSVSAPLALTVPWLALVPVVVVLARWFTQPERLGRWGAEGHGAWRRSLSVGVSAAAWVRQRISRPGGRALFGWVACYWIGDIVSLGGALLAVGARPGLSVVTLAYATGYIAQALPIPFIATGGVDASTILLLHVLGVPLDLALGGVVAHRLFAFWLPVVPGVVFTLTLPRLGSALTPGRAVTRPEPDGGAAGGRRSVDAS
jgi:uncharacterized membrane protein YbhN (UPF0104 family)